MSSKNKRAPASKAHEDMRINKHKGTPLDSFLEKQGMLEEASVVAIRRVIAYGLEKK